MGRAGGRLGALGMARVLSPSVCTAAQAQQDPVSQCLIIYFPTSKGLWLGAQGPFSMPPLSLFAAAPLLLPSPQPWSHPHSVLSVLRFSSHGRSLPLLSPPFLLCLCLSRSVCLLFSVFLSVCLSLCVCLSLLRLGSSFEGYRMSLLPRTRDPNSVSLAP